LREKQRRRRKLRRHCAVWGAV